MKERDWEKVMARIDEQIKSLPDDEPLPARPPTPTRAPAGPGAPTAPAAPGVPVAPSRRSAVGAFLRLGLAATLALAMLLWPFDARCGFGLFAYLASAAMVVLGGGWSAVWTWRHRTPRAHVVALAVVLWGLVLLSAEILPRAGYGPATLDRPRIWGCG